MRKIRRQIKERSKEMSDFYYGNVYFKNFKINDHR